MNNFSPRISFMLDPFKTNRTFLRGGFAIMFDRVTSFIGFQERLNSEWRTYNFVNPGTTDPAVLRARVASGGVNAAVQPVLVKNLMKTPENRQLSLGIGQQFTEALGVNVDYVRQDIRNLYWLNANWFGRSLTPACYAGLRRHHPVDDFGGPFNGLVTRDLQRPRPALQHGVYLGFYESVRRQPRAGLPQPVVVRQRPPRGRARFVLSTISRLPWASGIDHHRWRRRARTGVRRTPVNDNNARSTTSNGRTQRPPNDWKYWYRTVDLRLQRALLTRGTQKLTVMAEVFNVFNTENISAYGGQQYQANGAAVATFGQSTAAFAARQAQLGFRVDF
jgi:hypothetical protein